MNKAHEGILTLLRISSGQAAKSARRPQTWLVALTRFFKKPTAHVPYNLLMLHDVV